MKKRASSLMASLLLLATVSVIANCGGGGGGGDSTPPPDTTPNAVRTMAESFRNADYQYLHGTNAPDGSLLVVANETNAGAGGTDAGMKGEFTFYKLTMSDVIAGTVTTSSILSQNTVTGLGTAGASVAFRQSFTPNGKLLQAGKDRMVVLNSDLSVYDIRDKASILGTAVDIENHDVLAIDNDFALLGLQLIPSGATFKTGGVVLYDIANKQIKGNPVSICSACHVATALTKSKTLCGIDGKFTKSGSTYTGTVYAATTSGGHIAYADLTIDSSTGAITVGSMDRIQVSTGPGASPNTMPAFHDVRLDSSANRVYYSAIKTDTTTGSGANRAHLGYVDLADTNSSTRVHDATIDSTSASRTGNVYCGSGQTATHFIPMTMSYPAYIDAVKKSAVATNASLSVAAKVHRTFATSFRSADYQYLHGTNAPDGSLLVVSNETTTLGKGTDAGMIGAFTFHKLTMSDVTAGKVTTASIISQNTITGLGTAGASVAFRQSFTPNGKLLQAGKDRMVVLNSDLTLYDIRDKASILGTAVDIENHDVLAIDNDFALLGLQLIPSGATFKTGGVVLYDIANKQIKGNPVSICSACHVATALTKSKTLCGIDGKFTKSGSTYTGTVYAATTSGGHIAYADLTIDSSTGAITVGSMDRIQVSTGPGASPNTMPAFHDVRYDVSANKVYYSAIKADTTTGSGAGRAHLGYVDLADTNSSTRVHDATVSATSQAKSGNIYCGSGQTSTHLIPMTMSYPAYIDAIEKAAIVKGAALN